MAWRALLDELKGRQGLAGYADRQAVGVDADTAQAAARLEDGCEGMGIFITML